MGQYTSHMVLTNNWQYVSSKMEKNIGKPESNGLFLTKKNVVYWCYEIIFKL